ncbi:MAG: ATP-binding protein [Syntrophobacteria bacterium]
MKEIVVVSGKGGTGKTCITGSFAALASNKVMADADVDAADLFILLEPSIRRRESFRGGYTAFIDREKCVECGECLELCRFDAISPDYVVDKIDCEGCGVCAHFCPAEAVEMRQNICGEWYVSDTRYGPFVHARLGIAEENSGMLVTVVRHNAKLIAEEKNLDLIIVDGPPGIGCPVIAAITGASLVFIVTEPTLSGLHDMQRVGSLARHFNIPAAACINKYDLNIEMSDRIRGYCEESAVQLLGMIPYDPVVSKALVEKKIVVEYSNGRVAQETENIWSALTDILDAGGRES